MPRAKGGFKTRRRRNKVLKRAKGFRGARGALIRSASEAIRRAMRDATRDRRKRKRDFRSLWTIRIGIAAREQGLSFSKLIGQLKKANVGLNRKMLSELAIHNPEGFAAVVQAVNSLALAKPDARFNQGEIPLSP